MLRPPEAYSLLSQSSILWITSNNTARYCIRNHNRTFHKIQHRITITLNRNIRNSNSKRQTKKHSQLERQKKRNNQVSKMQHAGPKRENGEARSNIKQKKGSKKIGQFYSHVCVNTRETWTHENQPHALLLGGDLNARKPTEYILNGAACEKSVKKSNNTGNKKNHTGRTKIFLFLLTVNWGRKLPTEGEPRSFAIFVARPKLMPFE